MYIDLEYEPTENDLICEFYVEPNKIPMEKACMHIAAESSVGTWTEIPGIRKEIVPKVFYISGNIAKIAYPSELFEGGNAPQILSSIAGNIFGMAAIKNLRLNDIYFPKKIVKSFKGPRYGISGVREILKVKKRPLIGTIVKPKLGLNEKEHAKVAYEAWIGGVDLVKDDENLTSMSFNKFEKRIEETLKLRDKAESETGERKAYIPNITAETKEMLKRAKLVEELDGEYVMVDILTLGFSAFQTLRNECKLAIHAHRAMHASFTRNKKHGISMVVIAKISRLIGADQLHIGTFGVGKMLGDREEELKCREALTRELFGLNEVFPVCSGGLHPASVEALIKIAGLDIIIQAGGGIHGHPLGSKAGARAMRQAIEAVLQGKEIKEYAKKHKELKEALKKWSPLD
ncbi:MAG: type III ribulose-bisphosphate carboxylase [Thermoplasmata archaeon]|nr:MAG: type III ribulose-bisphosphate carboxylase [Thermoplasmata archaeon]